MFTVVDEDHHGVVGEYSAYDRDRIFVGFDLDTERRRECRRDELDVADRGKVDEERTRFIARMRDELDGEAGLADPARRR